MAKVNDTITLDVHGLTAVEAKERIEKEITRMPKTIKKVVVIHGYNNGTVLKETVRHRLRSNRISDISPSFVNDGETIIFLR